MEPQRQLVLDLFLIPMLEPLEPRQLQTTQLKDLSSQLAHKLPSLKEASMSTLPLSTTCQLRRNCTANFQILLKENLTLRTSVLSLMLDLRIPKENKRERDGEAPISSVLAQLGIAVSGYKRMSTTTSIGGLQ